MKRTQTKIYNDESLLKLLRDINAGQNNYITPWDYNNIDALRIDNKCSFFENMPFSCPQYLYIKDGSVTVATSYDAYRKKVSSCITTRNDFFKAFSKLNLYEIKTLEDIVQAFPREEITYEYDDSSDGDYNYYNHFQRQQDYSDNGMSNAEIEWNSDLEIYTIGGI